MPRTYLDAIEAVHRERAARDTRDWRERARGLRYDGPRLEDALRADPRVRVIAEVKRRSPSKGWLNEHLDPASLARAYAAGGAAAISVLTDEEHFSGSRADLEAVRASVTLPVLRKDFTVSENDVVDTAEMGASGVLLIAAILSPEELRRFWRLATELGLSPLVEVHDAREVDLALELGARIIGVNQRDLHTFEVDHERACAMAGRIPPGVVAVAESGIRGTDDVQRLAEAGYRAVLVGELLVRSADRTSAVAGLLGVGP